MFSSLIGIAAVAGKIKWFWKKLYMHLGHVNI